MTFDSLGLFELLRNLQKSRDDVKITILMEPFRGKNVGNGSGMQTRFRVYQGDNLKVTIAKPYYVDPGKERTEVDRLTRKHGKSRVVLRCPDDTHSAIVEAV